MFSDLAATFNCHRRVTRMRYPEPACVVCCVSRNPFFCGPVRLTLPAGTAFFARAAHPAKRPRVTPPWPCANLPSMNAGSNAMRATRLLCACAALLMAGLAPAAAQNRTKPPAPAPAAPYQPVMITPPKQMTDESFEAMRKQLGEAVQRKDRAAMARLVVAQGFFWQREKARRVSFCRAGECSFRFRKLKLRRNFCDRLRLERSQIFPLRNIFSPILGHHKKF